MAKKVFGPTNFTPKDFKDKKKLGEVETKRKPGFINTAPSSKKKL